MADKGIQIHYFLGNHDLWGGKFFEKECNAIIYKKPTLIKIDNDIFYIGHGDGIVPQDKFYIFIKKYLYTNIFFVWLFRQIHPDIGVHLAKKISALAKKQGKNIPKEDYLEKYFRLYAPLEAKYIIFGHTHKQTNKQINSYQTYINLGYWLEKGEALCAIFNKENLEIKQIY